MGMTKTQRHDDVTAPQAERRANSPSFRPAAFGRPFRVGFRAHLDFRNRVIAMAEDAKQLFSTEEWLSFPEIEKNRYENILRNYKMMKDLGEFCPLNVHLALHISSSLLLGEAVDVCDFPPKLRGPTEGKFTDETNKRC